MKTFGNPGLLRQSGIFLSAPKKTRLAPGCKFVADVLITVLCIRYDTVVIFGDQR